MNETKNFITIAGILDYVSVVDFANLLIATNPRIAEAVADNAMERVILDIPVVESNKKHFITREIIDYDVQFAAYEPGMNDMYSESSEYKTFNFQYDPVLGDNLVDVIVKQLLTMFEIYQSTEKFEALSEAIEHVSVLALEDYITPTHAIQLSPNTVTAVSIHDFEIAYKEIDGIINVTVSTDKPKCLRAVEAPNMY